MLVRAQDEHMQSRFVAQRILELREEGVELNEIAVLFRSSFHAFDLELELQRRNIPFIKRGGFKFIETAHIKDVLAHLRVIANPIDAVSWMRVLVLVKGVGNRTAERLIEEIVAAPEPEKALIGVARESWHSRAETALEGCARLADLLGELRARSDAAGRAVRRSDRLLRADRCATRIPTIIRSASATSSIFQNMAERYRSLESMLADMALEPPNDSIGDVLASDRGELRDSQHYSFGEGARMARGVFYLGGGRTLSRSDERGPRGFRRGAPPDVRREHARARRTISVVSDLYVRPGDGLRDGAAVAFLEDLDAVLPSAMLQEDDNPA